MDTHEGSESQAAETSVAPAEIEGKPDSPVSSGSESFAPERHAGAVEALLLSVDRAVAPTRIAEALGLIDASEDESAAGAAKPAKRPGRRTAGTPLIPTSPLDTVEACVKLLNEEYERSGRAFRIERVAGGFRVMTLPEFAPVLEAYHGRRERQSLSRAAVETLSIIAYKQPMARSTLETIRGVACGEVLRSLVERRLVTIVGRAEEVGRPILYGTTREFLEVFGLSSLKDLPSVEEFKLRGAVSEDA